MNESELKERTINFALRIITLMDRALVEPLHKEADALTAIFAKSITTARSIK